MRVGFKGAGLALAACALATPAAAQDASIQGRWRTSAQDGVVEIRRCGQALCGYVVDAAPLRRNPDQTDVRNRDAAERDRPLRGLGVLSNFTGGPTEWRGGPVYDPDSGQSGDRGRLTLTGPNTLEVQGCVARVFCRTQTWRRAN